MESTEKAKAEMGGYMSKEERVEIGRRVWQREWASQVRAVCPEERIREPFGRDSQPAAYGARHTKT